MTTGNLKGSPQGAMETGFGNPQMFTHALRQAAGTRRADDKERLIWGVTAGQGYHLVSEWASPRAMLKEMAVRAPIWLGHMPRVERWERNGDTKCLMVFRSREGSWHPTTVFEFKAGGGWRRVI